MIQRTLILPVRLTDLEAGFLHSAGVRLIENKRVYFDTQQQLKLIANVWRIHNDCSK